MNGKTYKIKSPAKINIGLRVLNKRPDGYHNIETIFYPIGAHDDVIISITDSDSTRNKISVKTNPQTGIDGKNNICFKAAEMFLDEFKIPGKYKIDITIKKNIPIGAGLGGGSSNAAAVLKVLAKHFKKNNPAKIKNTALRLGSDVPFFLLGKPAYASSRGEKLKPLPGFKLNYKILVVNPGIHVSTKWAYGKLDSIRQTERKHKKRGKLGKIQKFSLSDKEIYQNDFEEAVFKKYPSIRKIKEGMYKKGTVFSSMSGSGSAVYGFFEKRKLMPRKILQGKIKVFTV